MYLPPQHRLRIRTTTIRHCSAKSPPRPRFHPRHRHHPRSKASLQASCRHCECKQRAWQESTTPRRLRRHQAHQHSASRHLNHLQASHLQSHRRQAPKRRVAIRPLSVLPPNRPRPHQPHCNLQCASTHERHRTPGLLQSQPTTNQAQHQQVLASELCARIAINLRTVFRMDVRIVWHANRTVRVLLQIFGFTQRRLRSARRDWLKWHSNDRQTSMQRHPIHTAQQDRGMLLHRIRLCHSCLSSNTNINNINSTINNMPNHCIMLQLRRGCAHKHWPRRAYQQQTRHHTAQVRRQ
jgi:hypothetical protein